MNVPLLALGFIASLFIGMLVMLEAGRWLGARHEARHRGAPIPGLGAVEGSLFALMGLLVAFSFGGAADRLSTRRQLLVTEVNAIGTAYLRLDLLPADSQPALRGLFRGYLDARLAAYDAVPDMDAVRGHLARANQLQGEIWTRAVHASQAAPSPEVQTVVLPALNEMIDITTTRTVAAQTHPPNAILALLCLLPLACSMLAGYNMGASPTRSWMHIIAFTALLTLTVYVTMDMEYPRVGIINIEHLDQLLRDLRATMR